MTTILVIDDEPDIREVMRFALESSDFRVMEAGHADEARKLLSAETPDLILLDWMLPGRSGLELAQQLKQSPKTKSIPIIMVSARGEEEDRVKGLDTGADDYIAKPFSPREMVARVKAVLRLKLVVKSVEPRPSGISKKEPAVLVMVLAPPTFSLAVVFLMDRLV